MARKLCLAALILASLSLPAWGQQQCIPLDIIDEVMRAGGEAASVEGVDGAGTTLRIYANTDTGAWHLFVIRKGDRNACLVGSGEKYSRYPSRTGRGA